MGVFAVILGILDIVCAFLATMMFGNAGAIVAGVLAVAAVVLAILKRKKSGKGGIPAVVISALAIILAIVMAGFWSGTFTKLHEKAVEFKPDGLWARATENTTGGLMGIIGSVNTDEASLNALLEEMNELNKLENPQ